MRVLVTGAQGQLARSLVERGTFRSEMQVVTVGRPQLDLAEPGSAAAVIKATQPDVVINAAAYTAVDRAEEEPELAFRINAEAAGEVAAAAGDLGIPVIQISTDYVFDGRDERPKTEDSEPHPLCVYGRSKLRGECRVRAANQRHMIIRTAWVYSPFARNFVKTVMEAANTQDLLEVVDDQVGSPTSALDLAEALLHIVTTWNRAPDLGIGETYHIAGTGEASWYKLAEFVMIERLKNDLPATQVRPIRSADWPMKAMRPANSALDSRKFAREFDFVMPTWQQSVSAVVARLSAGS